MSGERILVVEDDPSMRRLISNHLNVLGYDIKIASDGPEALRIAANGPIDLVLLDITLPTMNGLEVARRLHDSSSVLIILVTAKDSAETKIKALDIGADDYLTKPFHSGELAARIRAVLRRASRTSAPDTISIGNLTIHMERRVVTHGDEQIPLTKLEFGLLRELASNPETVLTYQHLLESVWGAGNVDPRPVHVHICHLRRKIERGTLAPRLILPVPGVGYRFRMPD